MNIKITYDWLLEYLETDATPYELQKYLSLCGPGVERVEKIGEDYVLDIEITTNRVDMASVFGIAQEAQAILPMFGKKARLKMNPLTELTFGNIEWGIKNKELPLEVIVTDPSLASRVTMVVLSDIQLGPSPEKIKRRLELCDIRSINNAVDITNYIMLSLGQPSHIYDYDKIEGHKMTLRESKKGEKVTTLDGKEITLPGNDIVFEDGSGKLIDLCGIMGGQRSAVNESTKNAILYLQTYDKKRIRKTSMLTGQRSVAAAYFEKGLDEERVEPAMIYGIKLVQELTKASISSKLIDLYKKSTKTHSIEVEHPYIINRIGVDISPEICKTILENLGFIAAYDQSTFLITIPFWRTHDIEIPEDIVEEIARIYGYHNLPNNLPPSVFVKQPDEVERLFTYQSKIKYFLRHLGLHESMNYSMISKEMIENMSIDVAHHLKLSNTISEELQYMRISLLPSLVKNIKDNTGKRDTLSFFEISKVYYPEQKNTDDSCPPGNVYSKGLPTEVWKLAIATNSSFEDVKGMIEALLYELRVTSYELRKGNVEMFSRNMQVDYVLDGKTIGTVGQLAPALKQKNGLKSDVYLAGFDLQSLVNHAKLLPQYKPVNPFATIKLDLTLESPMREYSEIVALAKKSSTLLEDIQFVGMYKNKLSLRFFFSSKDKNITDKEAAEELEKIKKVMGQG